MMITELQVLNPDDGIKTYNIPSIYDVIEEFLRKFNSPHTIRRYRKVLYEFCSFARVNLITDLRHVRFDNMLALIRDYTESITVNRSRINTLAILKSFFNYLQFTYNYPKNPVSKQIFDMRLEQNSSSTCSLSEIEIIKLMDALRQNRDRRQKDYRDYLLIGTMLTTSLRISEVLQIDAGKIQTDNITGQYYIEVLQKKNRLRKVLIPRKLMEDYQQYAREYSINGPLFTTMKNNVSDSTCLTQAGCYKIIRSVVREYIGKQGIGNHSMRKSFIELANKRKLSPVSIMKATGHSTLQMIKYYDTSDELANNATF